MTAPVEPINVLFLCTHNSGRSILAEALTNHVADGRLRAYSAGSHPAALPNPTALETLRSLGIATDGLSSKSWDVFARPDAPRMHLIVTVCDNAAAEVCPVWPGRPATAHWGLPDPARTVGSADDRRRAFRETAETLLDRVRLLVTELTGTTEHVAERAARGSSAQP